MYNLQHKTAYQKYEIHMVIFISEGAGNTMQITFTFVVSTIFLSYIAYSLWTLVAMFYPTPCKGDSNVCILPYLSKNKDLQVGSQMPQIVVSDPDWNCFPLYGR